MAGERAINTVAIDTPLSTVTPIYGWNGKEETSNLVAIVIRNPDDSQIKVRLSEYTGHSFTENLINEVPESFSDLMDGGDFTYPQEHQARREAGLLASTEDLRSSLIEVYTAIASTKEGTQFFTENAKQISARDSSIYDAEVSWVSPKQSNSPVERWKEGEMTGNMRYRDLVDQVKVIQGNHRGVAAASPYIGQENSLDDIGNMSQEQLREAVRNIIRYDLELTNPQEDAMIEIMERPAAEKGNNEISTSSNVESSLNQQSLALVVMRELDQHNFSQTQQVALNQMVLENAHPNHETVDRVEEALL